MKTVNPNIMLFQSVLFDIRGHKMKIINYWEQFLSTGKIYDYLTYRKKEASESEKDEGAGKGAGTDQRYRDGFKSGTSGGI